MIKTTTPRLFRLQDSLQSASVSHINLRQWIRARLFSPRREMTTMFCVVQREPMVRAGGIELHLSGGAICIS